MQARNKPIEPPKKPESAPFFLPSAGLPGQDPTDASATLSIAPASSLRMTDPRAERVDNDSDDNDALVVGAPRPPRQTGRRKPGQLSARLWCSDPLMRALHAGAARGDGDFAAAVTWLRRASAVAVERSVLSVPAEEPFEEVRIVLALCNLTCSCVTTRDASAEVVVDGQAVYEMRVQAHSLRLIRSGA